LSIVIHSYGVHQPGQNRDKFPRPFSASLDASIASETRRRRSAQRRKLRGCIYARFSTKFQHSLEDQTRACLDWAAKNDVEVDLQRHIFTDAAISGKKRQRAGLEAMLRALDADEIDVVITLSTNRLHRKIHLALKFVEEEIIEKKRRCVFVLQNIDTANTESWKQLVFVFAMVDEVQVTNSAGHIRAAHVGLLLSDWVHGSVPYGYTGIDVEGPRTKRDKPRQKLVIEPEAAEVAKRVFNWFVEEGIDYHEIARLLRKENAPPPAGAEKWSWLIVRRMLQNRRYIGDWSYGRNETIWQSKADYGRRSPRAEPHRQHQNDSLRIVDDATFHRAQERMAKWAGRGGRKRRNTAGDLVTHPLKDLLWCDTHQRYLKPYGAHGERLACPACKADNTELNGTGQVGPLFSSVNRELALSAIIKALAPRISADQSLINWLKESAHKQIEVANTPDPERLLSFQREVKVITENTQFILDHPGDTETDRRESGQRLQQLRARRSSLERQIADHEAFAKRAQVLPPDSLRIETIVRDLAGVLKRSASGDSTAATDCRKVLSDLTGGRIAMSQAGEAKAQRGWLRGSFRLQLLDTVTKRADCPIGQTKENGGEEIVIDFVAPTLEEARSEPAKLLWDQGKLMVEIARELGMFKSQVTAALKYWFESRGQKSPDGRGRRSSLVKKSLRPPRFQEIAPEVLRLYEQGMPLGKIAVHLHVDRATLDKSLKWLAEQNGLALMDGRARRKQLGTSDCSKSSHEQEAAVRTDQQITTP
jgi:site-specific DNA recombinase